MHTASKQAYDGGRESLQVEFNVLGGGCGGCPYHSFPYKAQLPIIVNGKREVRTFTCEEDVHSVIDLLIEEVKENNLKGGSEFDGAQSVNTQLPFFACKNILLDKNIQKDIQRYIYCSELGVSPYKGDYGQQPAKWVDRFFIIKKAFAKAEKQQIAKAKRKK